MAWIVVLCLLAFDLVHRFDLIETNNASVPRNPIFGRNPDPILLPGAENDTAVVPLGLEDEEYMEELFIQPIQQNVGHFLLASLNNSALLPDLESLYRIKCLRTNKRRQTQYLTLTIARQKELNISTEVSNVFPLVTIDWENMMDQKWELRQNPKESGKGYHVLSSFPASKLPRIGIGIFGRFQHNELRINTKGLSQCLKNCHEEDKTSCEQNSQWLLQTLQGT